MIGAATVENVRQDDVRNYALDFTKGTLVLFMILYHWLNYFVGVGGTVFTYLRFIPPSFMFLAGFMIANFYPAKYGLDGFSIQKRLMVRALKLLLLFTLLNVVGNLVVVRSYRQMMPGIDGFLQNAVNAYIIGNVKTAFSILVPIGYLLLISAAIFGARTMLSARLQWLFLFLGALAVILDFWCDWNSHLMLLGVGLLGVSSGFTSIDAMEKWVDHPNSVLLLNLGYLGLLTVFGENSLLQVIGVYLSVAAFYLLGMKQVGWEWSRDLIVLLGKYSLFAYVAQIVILQMLFRFLPYLRLNSISLLIVSCVGVYALTFATVMITHEVRARSYRMDWVYRAVFA